MKLVVMEEMNATGGGGREGRRRKGYNSHFASHLTNIFNCRNETHIKVTLLHKFLQKVTI